MSYKSIFSDTKQKEQTKTAISGYQPLFANKKPMEVKPGMIMEGVRNASIQTAALKSAPSLSMATRLSSPIGQAITKASVSPTSFPASTLSKLKTEKDNPTSMIFRVGEGVDDIGFRKGEKSAELAMEDFIKKGKAERETIKKSILSGQKNLAGLDSGFLGVVSHTFLPTRIALEPKDTNYLNSIKKEIVDDYIKEHPVAGAIGLLMGEVSNLLLFKKIIEPLGIYKSANPIAQAVRNPFTKVSTEMKIGRIIASSAETSLTFALKNAFQESLNQIQSSSKFDPWRVATQSARGGTHGAIVGSASVLTTLPSRAITAGLGVGTMTALEKKVINGEITSDDIFDITVNSLVAALFQVLGGKGKTQVFKAQERDAAQFQMFALKYFKGDIKEAEKFLSVLYGIPKQYVNLALQKQSFARIEINRMLDKVPVSFNKADILTQTKYINYVGSNVMKGKDVYSSILSANKANILPTIKSPQVGIIDQAVVKPTHAAQRLGDIATKMEKDITGKIVTDVAKFKTAVAKDIVKINPNNFDSPGKIYTAISDVLKKHNLWNTASKANLQATIHDTFSVEREGLNLYASKPEVAAPKMPTTETPSFIPHAPLSANLIQEARKYKTAEDYRASLLSEKTSPSKSIVAPNLPKSGLETKLAPSLTRTREPAGASKSTRYIFPSHLYNLDEFAIYKDYSKVNEISQLNKPAFESDISKATGLRSDVRIKAKESFLRKIKRYEIKGKSPAEISDVLASRITVEQTDVSKQISNIQKNFDVVELQDFFKNPTEWGYQGINIKVRLPNKQLAEIQIHTPESLAISKVIHPIYERWRNFDLEKLTPEQVVAMKDDLRKSQEISKSQLTDIWNKANQEVAFSRPTILDTEMVSGTEAIKQGKEILTRLKLEGVDQQIADKILDTEGGGAFGASLGNQIFYEKEVPKFTGKHEAIHIIHQNVDNIDLFKKQGITKDKLDEELRIITGDKQDIREILAENGELRAKYQAQVSKMSWLSRFFKAVKEWFGRIFRPQNKSTVVKFLETVEKGKARVPTAIPTAKTPPATYLSKGERVVSFSAEKPLTLAKQEGLSIEQRQEINQKIDNLTYKQNLIDPEGEIFSQIFTEIEMAEAGRRIQREDLTFTGIQSTFPQWIPEELRSRKLFDKVQNALLNTRIPKNKRELDLFTEIQNEYNKRLGIKEQFNIEDFALLRDQKILQIEEAKDFVNKIDKILTKQQEAITKGTRTQIKKATGQEPAPFVTKRETTLLKDRIKNYARGVREGAYDTRQSIKQAQTELDNIIKNSNLETNDKAKFLTTIKNVQTSEQLSRILPEITERIDRLFEASQKREIGEKIHKELKYTKPIKAGQKLVGKYDYESNKFFEELRSYEKLNQDSAQIQLDAMPIEGLTELDLIKTRFLSLQANGAKASLELYNKVLSDIKNLKAVGELSKNIDDFIKRVEQKERVDEVAKGILAVKGDIRTKGFTAKVLNTALNFYREGFSNVYSMFNSIMGKELAEKYDPESIEIDRDTAYFKASKQAIETGIKIFELKNAREFANYLIEMNKEASTITDFEGLTFAVSKSEIINIYNSIKNDLIRERHYNAFGQNQIDSLIATLTPQEMKWADSLMEDVGRYREILNKRNIEFTGRDLGTVANYWPASSEYAMSVYDDMKIQGETPSALKARVENSKIVPKFKNVWEIYLKHIAEAEHINYLSRRYETLIRIFKDRKIKNYIVNKFGDDIYNTILEQIDSISLHRQVERIDAVSGVLGAMVNNWVKAKISSPAVFAKQLISVINYVEEMNGATWAKYFTEGITNPKETFNFVWKNAPFLEARFHKGYSEAITEAMKGASSFDITSDLTKGLSWLTRSGDITAIIYGGYPVIKDQLAQGKSMKEAVKVFKKRTAKSQQSAARSGISLWQNKQNALFRMFLAFKNTSNQYLRKQTDAIISYANKDISATQLAKTTAIYSIINPIMYVLVGYMIKKGLQKIGRKITGTEDDDEDDGLLSDIFIRLAISPIDAIPLFSDITNSALRHFAGKKTYQVFNLAMVNDVEMAWKKMWKVDKTFIDYLQSFGTVVEVSKGIPVLTGLRYYNYLKGGDVKTEKRFAEELSRKIDAGDLTVKEAKEKLVEYFDSIKKSEKKDRLKLSEQDFAKELLRLINSGEMPVKEAKEELKSYFDSIKKSEKKDRFKLSEEKYAKELLRMVNSGEMSVKEMKEELMEYLKQ